MPKPISLRIDVLLCLLLVLMPGLAAADEALNARVRERLGGKLRWAADAEGGAPFVLRDPQDPAKIIGFEVELAEALAKKLGLKAEFVQYEWVNLIPGVQQGDFDAIINGLEITSENRQAALFTRPYYIFQQQLSVRKDDDRIESLDDCKPGAVSKGGLEVATLSGSAADRMLQQRKIPVRGFDGQVEPYLELDSGRVDGVLLDYPIALYYGSTNPGLKFVASPAERFYYGVAVAKKDVELATALNNALGELMASGELRKIYRRWHLWDKLQPDLADPPEAMRGPGFDATQAMRNTVSAGLAPPVAGEPDPPDAIDINVVTASSESWTFDKYAPLLLQGAAMTIFLSIASMAVAMTLGLLVALCRIYGPAPLRWLALAYVEFFRGIPLLLLLFFLYFAVNYYLAQADMALPAWLVAIIGFGLTYAAYEAEIYRASITSVPAGQWEAGAALGMTRPTIFRRIIFPQAVRTAIPPIANDFIALFKDTSLVSVIAVRELTKEYLILSRSSLKFVELGLMTAALYLIMSVPMGYLARYLEKRWSKGG